MSQWCSKKSSPLERILTFIWSTKSIARKVVFLIAYECASSSQSSQRHIRECMASCHTLCVKAHSFWKHRQHFVCILLFQGMTLAMLKSAACSALSGAKKGSLCCSNLAITIQCTSTSCTRCANIDCWMECTSDIRLNSWFKSAGSCGLISWRWSVSYASTNILRAATASTRTCIQLY